MTLKNVKRVKKLNHQDIFIIRAKESAGNAERKGLPNGEKIIPTKKGRLIKNGARKTK